jgi:hypothetical protein
LHSYINQNLSYYCHFLHWQRPFKILLCVVSVNESCIPISIKNFLTIATSYTGRDRSRFCYVLLALMKVAFLYQSKSFYYCHFLYWQRSFKILLCVVSVNESCIPISIKIFLTIVTSYTGRDRSRYCYVLLALMKVSSIYVIVSSFSKPVAVRPRVSGFVAFSKSSTLQCVFKRLRF